MVNFSQSQATWSQESLGASCKGIRKSYRDKSSTISCKKDVEMGICCGMLKDDDNLQVMVSIFA